MIEIADVVTSCAAFVMFYYHHAYVSQNCYLSFSDVCFRAETIRSALEVLAVCTIIPKAQLQLCEQVRQPDADPVPAIRFICGFLCHILLTITLSIPIFCCLLTAFRALDMCILIYE